VGNWYKGARPLAAKSLSTTGHHDSSLTSKRVAIAIVVLVALVFSKFFYMSSLVSYYTFYLISKFHVSIRTAQIYLFVFLGAVAVGTIVGGPIGDRIGRKVVIWCSILGVLPFSLLLPYASLFWTGILSVIIGLVLASAFSAILVYAQDLIPGKSAWSQASSSDWPSGWAASARRCWANSPTAPASISCITSVHTCPQSACSPRSCRI